MSGKLCLGLALTALSLSLSGQTLSPPSRNLVIPPSLAIEDSSDPHIFVPRGASIRRIQVHSAAEIRLSDPRWQTIDIRLREGERLGTISELTYFSGLLYVNDKGSRRILSIDARTGSVVSVFQYPHGATIDRIVRCGQQVAIGDSRTGVITLIARGAVSIEQSRSVEFPFSGTFACAASKLIYIDRNNGKPFLAEISTGMGYADPVDLSQSTNFLQNNLRVARMAAYNGSIYLTTTDGRLFVYSVDARKMFEIWSDVGDAALAVGQFSVYLLDADKIEQRARPVPIDLRVVGLSNERQNTFLRLYIDFSAKARLPLTTVLADEDYRSFEDFVFGNNVIMPAATRRQVPKDLKSSAIEIVCRFNQSECGTAAADRMVGGRVSRGATFHIPNAGLQRFDTLLDIPVGKNNIGGILQDNGLAAIPQQLNGAPVGSLENFLQQSKLILAEGPAGGLRPGRIVSLTRSGIPKVVGDVNPACLATLPTTKAFVTFAESSAPNSYYSLITGLPHASVASNDIDSRVLFSFRNPTWESVALNSLPNQSCFGGETEGNFVVTDAIRVAGISMKFLGSSAAEVKRLKRRKDGVLPSDDRIDSAKISFDNEFTFAYRALPLFPHSRKNVLAEGTDSLVLEQQTLWTAKEGSVTVPAEGWRLTTWATVSELEPGSLFRQNIDRLEKLEPSSATTLSVSIVRLESGLSEPQSIDDSVMMPACSAASALPATKLDQRSEELSDSIHYIIPDHASFSSVAIAMTENLSTLSRQHPTLSNAKWLGTAAQGALSCLTDPNIGEIGLQQDNVDHATFVAGLLVGQCAPFKGLIPEVPIFPFDSEFPNTMIENLLGALKQQRMWIINASTLIPNKDFLDEKDLKRQTSKDWSNALVVAAAGNDGKLLGHEIQAKFPLIISRETKEFPHVIGVGAPDVSCSNYGKSYVQLLAPGQDIVSASYAGGYVRGSGTSAAVPQVTAAAAMLAAQGLTKPSLIKARLIYTADPVRNKLWQDRVWGGLLNVRRAALAPDSNLLIVPGNVNNEYEIEILNRDEPISFDDEEEFAYGDDTSRKVSQLPLGHVLRIIRSDEPDKGVSFSVTYLAGTGDQLEFRIARVKSLHGTLRYAIKRTTDLSKKPLKPSEVSDARERSIDIADVFDFTAGVEILREIKLIF